ncbi:hypothetical protein ANN_26881 [Periplaneta americana]|uniref:Uncharacterized protein n=1 Tax=Periplaneta americana TaxID=6978 RepID=A0ABQ8RWG3_PERAM|nr:hypothetical protein ANN_26881 [Periplaneta americana]
MMGLCEGDNEPPGALNNILQNVYYDVHGCREAWTNNCILNELAVSMAICSKDAENTPSLGAVVLVLLVREFGTIDVKPSVADIRMLNKLRDELKDEQEVMEACTLLLIDETPNLDMKNGQQVYETETSSQTTTSSYAPSPKRTDDDYKQKALDDTASGKRRSLTSVKNRFPLITQKVLYDYDAKVKKKKKEEEKEKKPGMADINVMVLQHFKQSEVRTLSFMTEDDNNALSEPALRISYKICHETAKELKTFNEGEFIKRCLIVLADELCPQQVGEVGAICLSHRTVVRRQYVRMGYDDNNALSEPALRISYKICHETAKELKTFNEGEFIKRCLIVLADELCPQQVGEVGAICLSHRTVVRRQYVRMGYLKVHTKRAKSFHQLLNRITDDEVTLVLTVKTPKKPKIEDQSA